MQVIGTVPSIISSSLTMESAILLLSNRLLEKQIEFNLQSSETDQKNIISITYIQEDNSHYANVDISGVRGDYSGEVLSIRDDIPDADYTSGLNNPWSSNNLLECVTFSFLLLSQLEKNPIHNPDNLDVLTFTITQNQNQNEQDVDISINILLPVLSNTQGLAVVYTAEEYLIDAQ